MRFTTVLLSGLLAIASAQTTTTTPTTLATVTSTTSQSPAETSQSEITKCINACPAGDVGCTAKCIAVPNPDPAAVNATNQCVADCPKGNGTAADNLNYQNCVDACIGKYYFTTTSSGAGAAQATGTAAGGGGAVVITTTDRNGATVTTTSSAAANTQASGSGTGSSTGSATPSATGKNGGEVLRAGSAVGLVGFVAALMAF
ncbi:hypothetical protein BR93DRAFT_761199 [Coniochaeta sp. PMI_546]|nr:hypothetical protein BR93DRAFT_761199 [Coniochaeta sp. PMI_546]